MAKVFAEFRTAYLQREIPEDIIISGSEPVKVGQVLTLTAATGEAPAYYTAATDASKVKVGDIIIAQSDMTMGYGHVPVEYRDYRYSDEVAVTTASAPTNEANNGTKKVAFFKIVNLDDVILKTIA